MLSSVRSGGVSQAPLAAALIVVIEDDADIREVLGALLADEGYGVRTFADGVDALAAMEAGLHPDLIILDLMMPVMDGWQFRIEQRKRTALADVPLLVVSADESSRAVAVDADAFMRKPIDFARLSIVIERLLTASERRRLGVQSQETERLRSLGTLVAGVAHEINNPLTFVSGSLELAARSLKTLLSASAATGASHDVARRIEQALADARVGTERISTIVSSLSHFARAESTAVEVIDLHHVLDGVVTLAASAIRGRARLIKRYGDVPMIVGSESRLGQVFLNLLVNAAQSMPINPPSLGTITLVTGATAEGVYVEVSDSGMGIPEELTARVFEPFFTTKAAGEGTGLGLSISYDIVTAHGGQLSVRSTVGKGTTFRVELPARAERPAPTPPRTPPPPNASGAYARPAEAGAAARILVVDDEPMVCKLLCRVLSSHEVVTYTSALDALERFDRGDTDFDIIFCDLWMPDMDGAGFYDAIVEIHPELAERFVFMTGASATEATRTFIDRVGRPVLDKPFTIANLVAMVDARTGERDITGVPGIRNAH